MATMVVKNWNTRLAMADENGLTTNTIASLEIDFSRLRFGMMVIALPYPECPR
jgi:hypothetical protein